MNKSLNIRTRNQGFTLVELMITLVLSLMITYAIAQVLISSNRTSVTSDGMSQSQETGRFVMSYLAKQIRHAGLDHIDDQSVKTGAFISCKDFPDLADDNACMAENAGGETELTIVTPADPDRIHGDRLAIAWIPPADSLADCTGNTGYWETGKDPTIDPMIPYADKDTIINTFWVKYDLTSQMNSLFCQGFLLDGSDVLGASTAQAIANGVEAMQLLYGEASADLPLSGNRNISHYVPAPADPNAPTATDVSNWDRVYAVKVSIMTRSITDVTNSNALRSYVLANAAPYTMTDAVSRQVFTTTFALSNMP